MVEMRVAGLSIDTRNKTPVVVLREAAGESTLTLWVGAMEAMAISLVLNKETLPRPLTHDLLLNMLQALRGELQRAEIRDFRQGVYYAALLLSGAGGRARVDCRPSDAIALALRAGAPIMVAKTVLQRSRARQSGDEPHIRSLETLAGDVPPPMAIPDAATDMMRRAGTHKGGDMLDSVLRRRGIPFSLPKTNERGERDKNAEEDLYRELLRSVDPVSRYKM